MAKPSELIELHKAHGAVFFERDGWLLPAHFGDVAAEYQAARSAVAFIDLSHRGLLQLTGPDRLSFLQGMLSNDLKALKPFEGQYATLLTQQGKVVADLRVLCSLNSFYLDFWEHLKDRILDHLNRYLVADEVEIADRTAQYAILSLQGPRAEALLGSLTGSLALPAHSQHHTMATIEGTDVCIVRQSYTGQPGFDFIMPKASLKKIAELLTRRGESFAAAWMGEQALDILRIEAGIPRYGVDFTEDNLLLEVGIEHAVSFTKGCYLGQEVVERIRSRGHVNKKLCGLVLQGQAPASPGDKLYGGAREAGVITSSVFSPQLKRPIALGYVNKDFWEPGTDLFVHRDTGTIGATVARLPFVCSP
ncbi:MAG TPA: aminomethyltransferase family protein [Candidatus Binatia bacterium]|nr:aminomethyltransferase family protein [Candidatus Binatia bacterium]